MRHVAPATGRYNPDGNYEPYYIWWVLHGFHTPRFLEQEVELFARMATSTLKSRRLEEPPYNQDLEQEKEDMPADKLIIRNYFNDPMIVMETGEDFCN